MNQTPPSPDPELLQALELHRAGKPQEAAAIYQRLLAANPRNADALHLLGTIEAQTGKPAEGERKIAAALQIEVGNPLMWSNYGNVLGLLGRRDAAIAAYDKALALHPGFLEALYNRASHLVASGRAGDALAGFDDALEETPSAAPVRHILLAGRGNVLLGLERHQEALVAYEEAIALSPRNVDAITGRGNALKLLGRNHEALAAFEAAIALVPGNLDAILGKAHTQVLLGEFEAPLAMMDRVVAVLPGNALAHYIRGHALLGGLRVADALASFERAVGLDQGFIEAAYNVADGLRRLGRYPEAIPAFERVLALEPGHPHALSGLADVAMHCCDWERAGRLAPMVEANVRAGKRGMMPFSFLSLSSSKELQLACARNYTRAMCPMPAAPLVAPGAVRARRGDKIRLGYLSSDFRRHAMAYQMAELFEIHDRSRFEVLGFSAGPDDGSEVRKRIQAAFDAFADVACSTNEQIARTMHESGIDVAIDLNGHTAYSRMGALAWRPAPVQATYLGYPGTSGAPFIDYVLADETIAPASDQPFFSERIVHLPGCYQVSDRKRAIPGAAPSRAEVGLPPTGFVFACFNNAYKIGPEIYAVWMRLLKAVPGSVLWLLRTNSSMVTNLHRAANNHGVPSDRVVFCDIVDPDKHLARHLVADLFLDTLAYNSHTTGNFALWAGLPIVAWAGETFASRVALSMLRAVGLSELVTYSLEDYEALALKLALDKGRLSTLRQRLVASRTTAPLFDTDLFRRHIEAAYVTMHETAARGEPPRGFAVPMLG